MQNKLRSTTQPYLQLKSPLAPLSFDMARNSGITSNSPKIRLLPKMHRSLFSVLNSRSMILRFGLLLTKVLLDQTASGAWKGAVVRFPRLKLNPRRAYRLMPPWRLMAKKNSIFPALPLSPRRAPRVLPVASLKESGNIFRGPRLLGVWASPDRI